jgi:hypothetical protein
MSGVCFPLCLLLNVAAYSLQWHLLFCRRAISYFHALLSPKLFAAIHLNFLTQLLVSVPEVIHDLFRKIIDKVQWILNLMCLPDVNSPSEAIFSNP